MRKKGCDPFTRFRSKALCVSVCLCFCIFLLFGCTTNNPNILISNLKQPHLFGIATEEQALNVVGTYQAIDFNSQVGDAYGFIFQDSNCILPQTKAHYFAIAQFQFKDSSPSPNSTIAVRVTQNGNEIEGSYREKDIGRQDSDDLISTDVYIEADVNDVICLEWTASDIDVSIVSHETYADMPVVATGFINYVHD